jgi:hypothetical protein
MRHPHLEDFRWSTEKTVFLSAHLARNLSYRIGPENKVFEHFFITGIL